MSECCICEMKRKRRREGQRDDISQKRHVCFSAWNMALSLLLGEREKGVCVCVRSTDLATESHHSSFYGEETKIDPDG